jgi:cytochrome P450
VFYQDKSIMGDQDPRDIVSWFLKAADEGDPAAPHTESAWHEEARLMIIAGSDTSSVALANA